MTSDQRLATSDLTAQHCVPCEGGIAPMSVDEARLYVAAVPDWKLIEGEKLKITRSLRFKDFAQAMAFVNQVAAIAEAEGHHPDISIAWNRVRFDLVTHAIKGLSTNDFIMAAKINQAKEETAANTS
jgi:4a-hydroxytetrahydrobiopterin dehydratase